MNTAIADDLRRAAAGASAEQDRLIHRVAAELEFVEQLAGLHPAKTASWRKLADKAAKVVLDAMVGPGPRVPGAVRKKHASPLRGEAGHPAGRVSLAKAVEQAERVLAPVARVAKTYTLHCVGHAHIDMNWMWPWPETVAVTNDTFLTVLRLMEEFEDFHFTQSQASVYRIARRYHPELFEAIRRRVAEGRWEVAAVHWVEGDKNLVGGESLARHLLYTRRYVREQFGLSPEDAPLDWEPDTFGHAATIPTIVSRGGVRHYYLCRGGPADKPPVFWWRGPDGARILVNLETTWYLNHVGTHNAAAMIAFCQRTGLRDWMLVFGVGDHGGGPTRRDLLRIRQMDSWPVYPRFRFAAARGFYDLLQAAGDRWPVLEGELNCEFTGCYTSQSAIKKANRLGDSALHQAESAAAVAWRALGRPYPAEELRQGWIDTLFGHFHDILPGSGVAATRHYQLGLSQEVLATAGMVKTHSLRALAGAIDTSFAGPAEPAGAEEPSVTAFGAGVGRGAELGGVSAASHAPSGKSAVLVFNPTAWPRREVVTATLWDPGPARSFVVRCPDGSAVPAQCVGEGKYWGHEYVELALPVSVGPLGYAARVIEPGRADPPAAAVTASPAFYKDPGERQRVGDLVLANEHLRVVFDNRTGGIARLTCRQRGAELADPADPLAVPEYLLERPQPMSAWSISDPRRGPHALECVSLDYAARGPHVASVKAEFRLEESTVTVTHSLKAGSRQLDVLVQADWLHRGSPQTGTPSLRMRFPLPLRRPAARYEIPFGSIRRATRADQEVPALSWADVTGLIGRGRSAGLALLNDCKHGHSLDGSTLRLSLIRSTYRPDPLPELGRHEVRLAMVPHAGELAAADLHRLGAAHERPILIVGADVHGGAMPAEAAAIRRCAPAGVVLCGVKRAEDEDAMIFRLLETAGRTALASVSLDPAILGRVADAVEVDLLERPLDGSTARRVGNGFRVAVPACGLASVKVSFRARGGASR